MNQEQNHTSGTVYEIQIQERLDERWADWFEGMTFARQPDGTTVLRGQVALHGLLNGIRDLGLSLLSVQQETSAKN